MEQTLSHSSRPSEGTQTSGPSSYLRIWKVQRFNRATLSQGLWVEGDALETLVGACLRHEGLARFVGEGRWTQHRRGYCRKPGQGPPWSGQRGMFYSRAGHGAKIRKTQSWSRGGQSLKTDT